MQKRVGNAIGGIFAVGLLCTVVRAQEARPSFEVASVRENKSRIGGQQYDSMPGRFRATNATLRLAIMNAYEIQQPTQLRGGPAWIDSARFDIEARVPGGPKGVGDPDDGAKAQSGVDEHPVMLMLQRLLEERFKLAVHHEKKEVPVYFLVIAKGGPKFHDAEPGTFKPPNPDMRRFGSLGTVDGLVHSLSRQLGRTVIDKTGITGGRHNFQMEVPIEDYPRSPVTDSPIQAGASASAAAGAVIFGALERQLGLKLESGKAPVDFLIIDHVEKPSEN